MTDIITVDAYLDYPKGLTRTGKIERERFKARFTEWADMIRDGKDLALSAVIVGGEAFWNLLDYDMLYPRVIMAELRKNLSYGKDNVFVRFHVRKPPSKTGRTVGDNIWFSC
jgi:hypothetical protein